MKQRTTRISVAVLITIVAYSTIWTLNSAAYPSLALTQQQTNSSPSASTLTSSAEGLVPTNNTIIGNTIIPSTTNGTTTTAANATGVNATGVSPALLAQNITVGNALTKENTTAPVSPTGISTNAMHTPSSLKSNVATPGSGSAQGNSSQLNSSNMVR
jgi:hypothetical protein